MSAMFASHNAFHVKSNPDLHLPIRKYLIMPSVFRILFSRSFWHCTVFIMNSNEHFLQEKGTFTRPEDQWIKNLLVCCNFYSV